MILRLLIVMFLMESTWAAAAQYCRHELGIDAQQFGLHSLQYKSSTDRVESISQPVLSDDSANSVDLEHGCQNCHLGAMKSMLPMTGFMPDGATNHVIADVLLVYPHIVLRKPDRPNWSLFV